MHTVQRDGQQSLDTIQVWYDGTVELKAGYAVCYDVAAALTEGSDGFNEKIRGRVVVKPASANLEYFAGIVVVPPQKRVDPDGTYKGWCTISPMRRGTWVKALVLKTVTNTALNDVLAPIDGQWYLGEDANDTSNLYSRRSIAIAGEVKDCTAATNCLVMGIK